MKHSVIFGAISLLLSLVTGIVTSEISIASGSERMTTLEEQNDSTVSGISVEGAWRWNCCQGAYYGDMQLHQNGNRITGTFDSPVNSSGGHIDGTIQGDRVEFTIEYVGNYDGERQFYELTLSSDRQRLEGTLSGFRDGSVGVEFQAVRQ